MLPSWTALFAASIGTDTFIIILMCGLLETTLRKACPRHIGKIA